MTPSEQGDVLTRRGRKLPSVEEILWLHDEERISLREIGRHYGCNPNSVWQKLNKAGARTVRGKRGIVKPFDFAEAQRLREQEGLSYKEIGRRVGANGDTVSKRLRERGCAVARAIYKLPPAEVLAAENAAGATLTEIAERHGATLSAVSWRLSRAGISRIKREPRKKTGRKKLTPEHPEMVATLGLVDKGLSVAEVARRLGVTVHTVYRRLKIAGRKRRWARVEGDSI